MSYYSQYLFQSPLYEDTYYDYDVYDYLNENFYPEEINEMYKDFLIENFGIQIINEDYYDYIANRYGEENLLEGFVDSIKNLFGMSQQTINNPQERQHYEHNNSHIPPFTTKIPKWKYTITDLTRNAGSGDGRDRLSAALRRSKTLRGRAEELKQQADTEEVKHILGNITKEQMSAYNHNRQVERAIKNTPLFWKK